MTILAQKGKEIEEMKEKVTELEERRVFLENQVDELQETIQDREYDLKKERDNILLVKSEQAKSSAEQ